ncbi:MAG: SH3 domain-containing protein [Gammaproteobacteria bacterium]|nr:SH3 domain-containing protein [Gammaproteobacteria bacterium]MBV9724135.1 SH3 domain-containing protein [Gammaproteobacteria bacterium]
MIRRARHLALAGLLLLITLGAPARSSAREHLQLFVTEPYLELHTGPGRGYPVFHVVARDASVDVLFRRTDWFKVRTERGVEGWASQSDMLKTVLADGTPFLFPLGDRAGFSSHTWEMGIFAGQYGAATLISGYAALSFNSQLQLEAAVGNFLGKFTNGVTGDIGFAHIILPEARVSPFLTVGVGLVRTEPKATLVQPANRTEQSAYVGGGLRYYLTRRFFLRAEYKAHWIFTRRNVNEEADEWKLGFAFFY